MNNIIKLLCSIFASFVTVLSPLAVRASTININGLTYDLAKQNENIAFVVGVSDGKDNACGDIYIPYEINYGGEFYTVKYISQYAFEGCYAMTSVTIPGSISEIQWGAFKDCTGLTSVTIPASVSCIYEDAFSGCTGLKKFNINDGTEAIRLSASSLSNCPIENIYIGRPVSCSESGGSVFCDIKTFFSVTFGQKLFAIPASAFKDCSTLASVTIPDSVIYIGDYAFSGCSGLSSIAIPNSVGVINSNAFSGCDGLKEVHISSLESWCKIKFNFKDSNPLYYAHNLYLNGELVTDLVIPESISTLKNYVFSGYTSLTSVIIPNTVTDIGAGAFAGCSGLTSISIPNSVSEMDLTAFDNLNIRKLIVEDGTERLETIGDFDCALDTLYYGREIINQKGRRSWNVKKIIIGNLVTHIINNAFENWYELTSVIIPNSVTSIGNGAFFRCNNLSSITIPESVTSIGSDAFTNCFELTSLNIPDAVTSIGRDAFKYCRKLSSIHISSLESWCDISFGNEYSSPSYYDLYLNGVLVTDLVIPESNSHISNYAFRDCSSLTSVTIPESVTSIGHHAFEHCPTMVDVTIPNSVKVIGENAFAFCYALNSVNIPNSITSIKRSVFSGCSGLTSITIPESVTSIEASAFSGCSGLTSITIPASVTTIGTSAFSDCTSINAITVHALVPPQLKAVLNTSCFADNVYETATVGVPDDKVDDYMADTEWSKFLILMGVSEINPTDVKMENTEINLMESEKTTLKATVFPENAVDKILTWHSSNPSVASVDNEGMVTALMKGTAIISATTYNGINATCEVTVDAKTIDIERLTLNVLEAEILEGETVQLTAVVEPENATDKTVTWSSSDNTIATVNANGLVTGIYPGKVTIAATTANGLTATCDVTILSKVTASGVTLNIDEVEIFEGETLQLAATIEPENAIDYTITWSSSDVDIAVVDSDGLVTGIGVGTAIIRVSISEAPSIFDECVVTVSNDPAGIYDISEDGLNVRIVNRAILVEGCSPEATITLYTLTGLLVREMVAHDIIITIESVPKGCYILKIGAKAFKIAVP